MKQFVSVASVYNKSDNSLDSIKQLIKILDSNFEKSELILLVKNYHEFTKLDSSLKLSTDKVQVKFVSTYKMSKDYIFENVAWQSAIGDVLIYHSNITYLINYIENIIKSYLSSKSHILFLIDKYDSPNRKKRKFTFKQVNKAYIQHSNELINPDTCGYVINRLAINACFNNQKEQYDPFISLATSGFEISHFDPLQREGGLYIHNNNINDYSISDVLDMLTYYTKYGVHKLILYSILFILVVGSILTALLLHSPVLALFSAFSSIVFSILIGLYPQFIVSRQTFAAANEKNVVGHYQIKNV